MKPLRTILYSAVVLCSILALPTRAQPVLYVDDDAPPGGNGASWATAYRYLQDALAAARESGGTVAEVRVAQGAYKPDRGTGYVPGNRASSFELIDNVAVLGGYAGLAGQSPDDRDVDRYLTVLSGDLAGNDAANFGAYTDNCYHIVSSSAAVGIQSTLDGFTIRGGNAKLIFPPLLDRRDGGGFACYGSPTISRCVFEWNLAEGRGGALVSFGGNPQILFCVFRNNQAADSGGAICIASGTATLRHCSFTSNFAPSGGALATLNGSLNAETCVFKGNGNWGLTGSGGAILIASGSPGPNLLVNCLVTDNYAPSGGGVYAHAGVTISHCTLTRNRSIFEAGGAILVPTGAPGNVAIDNSILWGNTAGFTSAASDRQLSCANGCSVTYSIVQSRAHVAADSTNQYSDPRLRHDGRPLATSPCINAGDPSIAMARADWYGTPRPSDGRIDIGAIEWLDSDSDGLPDSWESEYFASPTGGGSAVDDDGDGVANRDEYQMYETDPVAEPVFVCDEAVGRADGSIAHPFASIQSAIDSADSGDTVLLLPCGDMDYSGAGNGYIELSDKALQIRACDGLLTCTEDNEISISGSAESSILGLPRPDLGVATLGNIVLNGAISVSGESMRLSESTINVREAGLGLNVLHGTVGVEDVLLRAVDTPTSGLRIGGVLLSNFLVEGTLELQDGALHTASSYIGGRGVLRLNRGAALRITGQYVFGGPVFLGPLFGETVLECDVRGRGDIVVDAGHTLIVAGGAQINLSGAVDDEGCGNSDDAESWGRIQLYGGLVLQDSAIRNANIDVLLADIAGASAILDNDIRLLETAAGYGGELFVSGDSLIDCNVIHSEGDRYLDLDPDPALSPLPTIGDNRIYVTIKQGLDVEEGELLELRAEDHDHTLVGEISGAHWVPDSQGYDDTWALERLEVLAGAKVNLTNRQGFCFQAGGCDGLPEAIYVKELVLHPGAVLNTGLQRLYYQALVDQSGDPLMPYPDGEEGEYTNGARIVDAPLLGFSLKVIAMDDPTEFDVRIRERARDPLDQQPPSPPFLEGSITRIESDPAGNTPIPDGHAGVMELRTRGVPVPPAPAPLTARSIAAKGAFARAGDEDILVAFDYLFVEDPDGEAEIVVYLSDDPDASDRLVEVARVGQPASGRAGSVGSGQFAVFSGTFPRGELNFTRGTYVELKLQGQPDNAPSIGAPVRVWIDNFDPAVCRNGYCTDFSGNLAADDVDLHYLLSEYGRRAGGGNWCIDRRFSQDGYLDSGDILSWEWLREQRRRGLLTNDCGAGVPPDSTRSGDPDPTPTTFAPGTLVVAGKTAASAGELTQQDRLIALPEGDCESGVLVSSPASLPGPDGHKGNGKLITDGVGELYQVHSSQGLVRLRDALAVIPPVILEPAGSSLGGARVLVGAHINSGLLPFGFEGVPLTDVVFDPADNHIAYALPVYVDPPGNPPYKAVARLILDPGTPGAYIVDRLYGTNPLQDPCTNTTPPEPSECRTQGLREAVFVPGVGGGRNVLVVTSAAQANENDWLLFFDAETSAEQRVLLTSLHPGLESPVGLEYAADEDVLYLAGGVNDSGVDATSVYRLSLLRNAAGTAMGVSAAGIIEVQNMQIVVDITRNPEDNSIWVLGFSAPEFAPNHQFAPGTGFFTTPVLATVPVGATVATAHGADCGGLALPVSLAWVPQSEVTGGACCVESVGAGNSTCSDVADAETCAGLGFVCNATLNVLPACGGPCGTTCWGDADGNGFVNAGDRGFISAAVGLTDPPSLCQYDMDGNGLINAGDRGFVSAHVGLCPPLPDYQNGSGFNHGVPDGRFGTATFMGLGTACADGVCPP